MKKQLLTLATVLFAAGALFTSCANDPEEPQIQPDGTQISTRAYGDKSPKTMDTSSLTKTHRARSRIRAD